MNHLTPLSPDSDGRDARGRFVPGNRLSKGNPHAQRVNRLRSALLRAFTPDDVREIVSVLTAQAKKGDTAAAALLFSYALGRPATADTISAVQVIQANQFLVQPLAPGTHADLFAESR